MLRINDLEVEMDMQKALLVRDEIIQRIAHFKVISNSVGTDEIKVCTFGLNIFFSVNSFNIPCIWTYES